MALHSLAMTREEFLVWVEAQEGRHEFDGFAPVAMTGGTARHSQIIGNLMRTVSPKLPHGCRALGPDAGLRTAGDAVRYPDLLVTCAKVDDSAREIPGVVVAFEVISPSSGYIDRIVKLREYRAVPTLRHYVVVEYADAALTMHARDSADAPWTTTALTAGEMLELPDLGIALPVAALYEGTDLAA